MHEHQLRTATRTVYTSIHWRVTMQRYQIGNVLAVDLCYEYECGLWKKTLTQPLHSLCVWVRRNVAVGRPREDVVVGVRRRLVASPLTPSLTLRNWASSSRVGRIGRRDGALWKCRLWTTSNETRCSVAGLFPLDTKRKREREDVNVWKNRKGRME